MINQSTIFWSLLLIIFAKRTKFASCYSAVALLEASVSMAETMEATLLVVVDNIDGKQWCTSTKKPQDTYYVAAGVCSCAKVAARETGRSCSTTLPPYHRLRPLAKLTPNMTARLMGRGCHGFECGASSGTSCQPRF